LVSNFDIRPLYLTQTINLCFSHHSQNKRQLAPFC
jgi:hypothetical protein